MARKQSNAFRTITGQGIKVNVETGVEIITLEFLGKRTGAYEVRRPALNHFGYQVAGTVRGLVTAKRLAATVMSLVRAEQAEAYDAACVMLLDEAEAIEVPAGSPSPVYVLLKAAEHSARAGYAAAANERIRKARAIIADPSLVPADGEANAALIRAKAELIKGTAVYSTKHGERGNIDGDPFLVAEDNRVCVLVKFAKGYASCYASALTR